MSTNDRSGSRWVFPAFSLFLGAVMFAAFAIGDNVGQGAVSFGIMAALAAVFAFGGRSETVRGLGGPERDERWAMIDLRATAFAGAALVLAVIIGFLAEVARGEDGRPYSFLGAIAGLAYVAGVAYGRLRG
jgi:drug/metabolite transporter (DMT)-like permease